MLTLHDPKKKKHVHRANPFKMQSLKGPRVLQDPPRTCHMRLPQMAPHLVARVCQRGMAWDVPQIKIKPRILLDDQSVCQNRKATMAANILIAGRENNKLPPLRGAQA